MGKSLDGLLFGKGIGRFGGDASVVSRKFCKKNLAVVIILFALLSISA
jgi:hypothetical protein